MGYHRPVSSFNLGKKSEHKERTHFIEKNHQGVTNVTNRRINPFNYN
jgi:hypothetical protein